MATVGVKGLIRINKHPWTRT